MSTTDAPITLLEMHAMLFVDCPLCDAPAPLDADAAALDCPSCAVRLTVAPDEPLAELAAAA